MDDLTNGWEYDGFKRLVDVDIEGLPHGIICEIDEEDDQLCDDEVDLSEETLNKIRMNDPAITSLAVEFCSDSFSNRVDWREEGSAIGENTHAKGLSLHGPDVLDETSARNLRYFCNGLAQNTSLRHLHLKISLRGVFQTLSIFFKNNACLRCVEVGGCHWADEGREMAHALSGVDHLKRLTIHQNDFGKRGHAAIASLLQNPRFNLEQLIFERNDTDTECAMHLAFGLVNNHTLKMLSFGESEKYIGPAGWEALSNVLTRNHSQLVELSLTRTSIDSKGMAAMSKALCQNSSLKILDLSYNTGVSTNGWCSFFPCLGHSTLQLEWLSLSGNNICNRSAALLGCSLAANIKLKYFGLDTNRQISSAGWLSLLAFLHGPHLSLEKLSLSDNFIDDEEVAVLGSSLNNSTLKVLDLSQNEFISPNGWQAFFAHLQGSNNGLEELILFDNNIGDREISTLSNVLAESNHLAYIDLTCSVNNTARISDESAAVLAKSLCHNSSLRVLNLTDSEISGAGWMAFAPCLCNESSIDAILMSNHTLRALCFTSYESGLPHDIQTHLRLNRNSDKHEVARQKIITCYFLKCNDNIQKFANNVDFKLLPNAIHWMAKNDIGCPLLYSLLLILSPALFDCMEKTSA